ncbi:Gamma-butyrobetaine dioxygenase [Chionoecetes opilio]|uniref:Gamma-butyrobetaine dioxygenase n=1 Tax=Chionoecetes opilio TaxID=41210 RepID=A0A8J4Y1L1_CHIOP|nr:Gamma-butyrobetaine dioxygenase [Chionoecetes opilio]
MSRRVWQGAVSSGRLWGRGSQKAVAAVAPHCLTPRPAAPPPRTLTTTHTRGSTHPTPTPAAAHHHAPGIKKAEARKEMLEVTFVDGNSSLFPYCWLRDNCQCPQCFDAAAPCRKLTLEDWHHDDCPTSVQVEEDGEQVEVRWTSGHSSRYEARWLQQRAFTPSARDTHRTFLALKKELWSTEMELPRLDYEGVMQGDEELLDFLVTVEQKGVAVLTQAPRDPEAVLSIINRIGFVKPTHYGIQYPIRSKASANSLAYTDQKLGMHNDLPYFQYVPGIIFLHCITQFEGQGGENDLTDGFQVAQYLKQHHPREYRILTDTPIYFWDKGVAQVKQETTGYHKIINIPIIVEDRVSGTVVRINNSQLRNSYLDLPPEQVTPWYAALRLFNQTLDQHSIRNKLKSGEMLVMDNTRLLHGRTGYDSAVGERHMNQAYLDWDGALSRRRVLQIKLGVNLK